ncbi:MAG: class I SAM-dependent methyltransferase [Acidimicrobiales bacterium]|nr:class I SAM-dependent methyltransferase [Acidimicrobiales bacterium]
MSPDVYDEDYFRHACGGATEWRESDGTKVAGIYPGCLHKARFAPGEVLVDIGTGRGELLAVAARVGAARAIGVEYAAAAVAMAEQTIAAFGVAERAEVILADARAIPLPDATADVVTMLDVVEHLSPTELHRSLGEARRLLKPGGRLLIHTFPTRTIYEVTYKLQRLWHRSWPAEPRNQYELGMHVNEQSLWSLRKAMRAAGFTGARVTLGDIVYTDMIPDPRAARLYHRLAKVPIAPLRALGVSNLWGEATR